MMYITAVGNKFNINQLRLSICQLALDPVFVFPKVTVLSARSSLLSTVMLFVSAAKR